VVGKNVYAFLPLGHHGAAITVMSASPSRGSLGRISATLGFLQSVWWQFLLAGAIAALLALLLARWLARGMTQPLRDMAEAARRMETRDYSQRVHTTSRDEVGQLATAFNRMSAELENLETSRRDLVANVSHELKTPIAAIRAHLENLLDGVEQPNPETLQVMLTQSERLGRLVEQLLDLSKLESGEVPLHREEVPLAPLVSQVVSEIDVARSDRGVAVRSRVPEDLPAIDADRERVHQVLFNLVDNAVRFTPEGARWRSKPTGTTGRSRSRLPTRAWGSPPSTCPGCSSASIGSTRPARARTGAPASASRSRAPSWRRTGATSRPRASRARGACSRSTCPSPRRTRARREPL
jgi:signal transduction histidine kinase